MIRPPIPWTAKGSRIYAADGEEIAVATKASPKHRGVTEATAAAIVEAVNAYFRVPSESESVAIAGRVAAASILYIKANDSYPDGHPMLRERYAMREAARKAATAAGLEWCPWCGGPRSEPVNVEGYGRCDHGFHPRVG